MIQDGCTFFFYRYETSSEVMSDVDCTKKAICEIYQNSQELGQLGERAMHGLGGFQLLDLITTELKSHMTCYNSMPLIG